MKTSNYSSSDQFLHNFFLGETDLSNFLYERIKKYKKANKNCFKVFISGLARSGTTSLLNQLFSSNKFGSLKYSHMPFILNPRLSKIFSSFTSKVGLESKERIHKDGINISIDSPECLDEPFWIKENPNYFSEELSINRKYDLEVLENYNKFLNRHAFFQDKSQFIIKNNNNHLRLNQLVNFFKDDLFIILFRDPIYHSISLKNTHKKICLAQKEDPFILDYMNLIGHREFGHNQKPFNYGNTQSLTQNIFDTADKDNYWLKSWINAYSWIYDFAKEKNPKNLLIVSYEDMCLPNSNKINEIFKRSNLEKCEEFILKNKNIKSLNNFDESLKKKAYKIYSNMRTLYP